MQANQQLLKQLSDQKYALDQAAIVAATDAKGVISYVNDKFCEVSGYSREELIGRTHKIVNSGVHSLDFFHQLWGEITKGKVWQGEVCNRKKNRELYWVYTTIVPFLDPSGKPIQYLSIRYEITELKEAQGIILAQQEKLVASSRLSAIGELAAAITHEINNPLGVILGRVEMLKSILKEDKLDKEELLRIADSIEVTGQRIEKIVRGMKTMAHHQEDDPTEKVAVHDLLEDAIELCQYRFQKSGIELRKPEFEKNLIVNCRSHQVVQVLVNLFSNSIDALSKLSEKWIEISVSEHANQIKISILDSGPGISSDLQKKIFNPFFSTKSVQYGTGLGLSISRGLLQKNKGYLDYDSSQKHTCFVVSLPST